MKTSIRNNVFETNSSSTHSITIVRDYGSNRTLKDLTIDLNKCRVSDFAKKDELIDYIEGFYDGDRSYELYTQESKLYELLNICCNNIEEQAEIIANENSETIYELDEKEYRKYITNTPIMKALITAAAVGGINMLFENNLDSDNINDDDDAFYLFRAITPEIKSLYDIKALTRCFYTIIFNEDIKIKHDHEQY